MMEINKIYQMDCIEGMKQIPDGSIDMILCDLPYGTTRNKWDTIIPLDAMWEQYKRITKESAAIVLTAQTPFDKVLGVSNIKMLRYEWIWRKSKPTGHLNAKKMPLKQHENILVFYKRLPKYFPPNLKEANKMVSRTNRGNYGECSKTTLQEFTGYPRSVLEVPTEGATLHPTQKPLKLFEYLIKTYTNEGETILDNCMGSGTTAIAAMRNNRNFIGFEIEPEYIQVANDRMDKTRDLIESGALQVLDNLN